MRSKQSVEQSVITRINSEIGNDLNKLHRAAILVEKYRDCVVLLKAKLDYGNAQNTTKLKSAIQNEKDTNKSIEFQMEKFTQFSKRLASKIEHSNDALKGVLPDLEYVNKMQQLMQYLEIVQAIQKVSHCLSLAVNGKNEAKIVNIYLTLFEDKDCENSIIGRLSAIEAQYLQSYALKTATYWHGILKERFSSEFDNVLKSMCWGQKQHDSLTYSPTPDNTTKAQMLAEYLFLIKSPIEDAEPLETITPSIIFQPVNIVTKLLLAPYRQRFQYHFTGIRQTNRLDKPEWFFTQILNWGKDSHLFVGKTFQPAAVKAGKLDYNIRLEFLRGLVQLAVEKISIDIEEISRDEYLFAHLLDETLAFEAELRDTFGYPGSFPSAICVVTQPVYLLKWISLEQRFCADKMDSILQGENPWMFIDSNISDDGLKIPKCADQFVRLLEAIKDRYYSLIQPGHQLQFLSLQLELIEDFRRRLVQLHSGDEVDSIPILNAINYLTMVLREWGENVHYLHLHVALMGPNANEINSVFDQSVKELEHWMQQLVESLATKAANEIKAKSMPYRHDCWSTMPEQNAKEPFILSPSAGEMFQVMVTTLHNLEFELSSNVFKLTLRLIANQIDDLLFDGLVMNSKFTPTGAAQFNYDITRNLFALFGQYNRRPDLLFKKVQDSNKLLNTARGTALLLHETLKSDANPQEKMKALKELGICNFKCRTSIEVLERRTDIRIL